MEEKKCVKCKHDRRAHNKTGCGETVNWNTGEECKCKVKFMEQGMFK